MKANNRLFRLFIAVIATCAFCSALQSTLAYSGSDREIVIIVNKSNPHDKLSTNEIEKIFLGKMSFWPDGASVKVCDLTELSIEDRDTARAIVARRFLHKELMTLKNYWIKMIFSGKRRPPVNMKSADEVIQFVASNKGGIGYVEPNDVTAEVRRLEIVGSND